MELIEESRLQAAILEGSRAVTMAHSETAVYAIYPLNNLNLTLFLDWRLCSRKIRK